MASAAKGRVLIVAGSDSGGGAGIQADIKTVTALQGFAATAITALTAQNTMGVFGVHPVPEPFIHDQYRLVAEDIGADAIKTGMLASAGVIETAVAAMDAYSPGVPRVVDPVMVAKGGHRLLEESAVQVLKESLVPSAYVITPNLPEAGVLVGRPIATAADMRAAADDLMALGPRAVLLKGGHLEGDTVLDLLITPDGIEAFEDSRIDTPSTHGTGCTLASAVATGLAQGLDVRDAVTRARRYTRAAILAAPGLGQGHGPLWHGHTVAPWTG